MDLVYIFKGQANPSIPSELGRQAQIQEVFITSLLGGLALSSGLIHPLHENLGDGVGPMTLAPSCPSDLWALS